VKLISVFCLLILYCSLTIGAPVTANAKMRVSKKLMELSFEKRKVSQAQQVSQSYEGGFSSGTFVTRGEVNLVLVPNDRIPWIGMQFTGQSHCPSLQWTRRNIKVWSSVTTNLRVVQQIEPTLEGLRTYWPQVSASSAVRPYSVSARCRIVEKIAWRQATQRVASAETNASSSAARRAAESLSAQVQSETAKATKDFQERFRKNIIFLGTSPQNLTGRTTAEAIEFHVNAGSGPTDVLKNPAPGISDLDLGIQFQESAIAGSIRNIIGAGPLRDEQLYALYKLITGDEPFELRPHERSDRWNIKMDASGPLEARFQNERIQLTLRGNGMCIKRFGEEKFECLDSKLSVSAVYVPTQRGDQLFLVREGDVIVELGSSYHQKFLHEKMRAFFSEEWNFDGLALPSGSTWEKFTRLKPARFTADSQWLTVGFNLVSIR
jgi:hypothetical protein